MSKKEFDIVVISEINPDIILTGNVEPVFSQVETLINDYSLTIGSSGAIFACGASKLGLRVSLIGLVGDDTFGHYMLDQLVLHGVDISNCIVDQNQKTGMSVILNKGEDRAILTFSGSMKNLCTQDFDWSIMNYTRHVHISSYYLQDALKPELPDFLNYVHGSGVSISLDTNYDPLGKWSDNVFSVLKYTDIFFPNEQEVCAISQQNNWQTAMHNLAKIVPMVVVKRGKKGAALRNKECHLSCETIPVEVVDTTGAGDSFNAGFLYGYLNAWKIEDTLKLACVCGALSTRAVGGTKAQPNIDEAFSYLHKI